MRNVLVVLASFGMFLLNKKLQKRNAGVKLLSTGYLAVPDNIQIISCF